MGKRRNCTPEFKAKVAHAASQVDATLADLAQRYEVHPNLITQWKRTALKHLPGAFASGREPRAANDEARIRQMLYFHAIFYNAGAEGGLSACDPALNIQWPLAITERSKEDENHPMSGDNYQGITA